MEETINRAPLEDLMVAMDVVDTLRHSEKMVTRELDSENRRERLIARLRDIYKAQGIEVTDAMLNEGVQALEEDRFGYTPPEKSFSTFLAFLYVKRGSWGKPLLILLTLLLLGLSLYYFTVVRPETQREKHIPVQIEKSFSEFKAISKDSQATSKAQSLLDSAQTAVKNGRYDEAATLQLQLQALLTELKSSYQLHVVVGPGKRSGIWRIPDVNTNARNYYLIVEAVDSNGKTLSRKVTSEESGKSKTVRSWGVRVKQDTFNAVAADKKDDGIIQRNIVGTKKRGYLSPDYNVEITGGAITEW